MYKSFFYLLIIFTDTTLIATAQSGATGTTGGYLQNLGYINFNAALGCDQQLSKAVTLRSALTAM